MRTLPETHVFRCGDRTVTATIREDEESVEIRLDTTFLDRESGPDDQRQFFFWFEALLGRYEDDERPVVVPNGTTGHIALFHGGKCQMMAVPIAITLHPH